MAKKKTIKFWTGSEGPFLFRVDEDSPESPFRWENAKTNIIERVTSREVVNQAALVTDLDDVTGAEYAAYRAAHFNSFGQHL